MIAWGKDKSESRVTAEFYGCAIEVMRGAEAISELCGAAAAGSVRHRILVVGRSETEADAARTRVGAPSHRGCGRRIAASGAKSRSASRPKARTSCALTSTPTPPKKPPTNFRQTLGQGHWGRGQRNFGVRPGDRPERQHHRPRIGAQRCWTKRLWPTADWTRSQSRRAFSCRPTLQRPHPRRSLGTDFRHQRDRLLHRRRRSVQPRFEAAESKPANLVLTTSRQRRRRQKRLAGLRHQSKAAANHLVRELAVELAPLCRVNAVAPATVVKGSTMFPRDRVISSLAKYDIEYSESEDDDVRCATNWRISTPNAP